MTTAIDQLQAQIDQLLDENKDLHEQLAFEQSKEVCTAPHDDDVIDGCPWCKIEELTRQLAER